MLNSGASKPRVKMGPGPLAPPPLDPHLMDVIKLKEFWNNEDASLVSIKEESITDIGCQIYWRSVNSSIMYNIQRRQEFIRKQLIAQQSTTGPQRKVINANQVHPKSTPRKRQLDPFHWNNMDNQPRKCNNFKIISYRSICNQSVSHLLLNTAVLYFTLIILFTFQVTLI